MPESSRPPIVPPGTTIADWLRALAAEVESDPALAERIAQSAEHSTSIALPPSASDATPAVESAPATMLETEPAAVITPATQPVEDITPETAPHATTTPEAAPPVLRQTRRSSRYGPPTIAGRSAVLGTGVPDPFAILRAEGEAGLRLALAELRAGTLRAIIRTHDLDPAGKLPPNAGEKRMVTLIIAAARRAYASDPASSTRKSRPGRSSLP